MSGSASFSLPGYALLCLAVISYALYSVFVEKASDYTGAGVTFVMTAAGAAVFSCAAIVEALLTGTLSSLAALPFRSAGFLAAVLYQGVGCSVIAYFLSNVAISRIGVNRTSSFIGLATAISVAAGVLILHEPFSLLQLVGTAVILCGVYVANSGGKRPAN